MAIASKNMRDICSIVITSSIEQKFDMTYLWKALRRNVKFETSCNNFTKDQSKRQVISIFTLWKQIADIAKSRSQKNIISSDVVFDVLGQSC